MLVRTEECYRKKLQTMEMKYNQLSTQSHIPKEKGHKLNQGENPTYIPKEKGHKCS